MKAPEIFIAHPQTGEQVMALTAFMQAMKIKFEIAKEGSYKPEFLKKIKESKKRIAQGNYSEVGREDLKTFLDNV